MRFTRAFRYISAALAVSFGTAHSNIAQEPAVQREEAARLVTAALEAELLADNAARDDKLAAAAALAADYAPAQWHQAKTLVRGEWLSLLAGAEAARADPKEAEYRRQRDALDGKARRDLVLARWCLKNGMPDRAELHHARLLNLADATNGMRREALKHLNLEFYQGRYASSQYIQEQTKREQTLKQAVNQWLPKLQRLESIFAAENLRNQKLARKQASAREQLQKIDDPLVVPILQHWVATQREPWALEVVALLARFPAHDATEILAQLAVLNPHETVRRAAIRELRLRSPHEFVPQLLLALSPSTQSQFLIQLDPRGGVQYRHQVAQVGARNDFVSTFASQAQPVRNTVVVPRVYASRDPDRIRAFENMRDSAEWKARMQAAAERRLAFERALAVERQVALSNALADMQNERFYDVLEQTVGQQLPRAPSKWWEWWHQYNEVEYSKPTYYNYNQQERMIACNRYVALSCFLAGTPVWTELGPRPIEGIRAGDRVLSQDPDTGELVYKLVGNVTLRPPSSVLKLTMGDESITTTLGHPFWVNGHGWRMAKELKVDDRVHTFHGYVTVNAVEKLPMPMPAHNLVVPSMNTYFVGRTGLLVHDNLFREPTTALIPGLVKTPQSVSQP